MNKVVLLGRLVRDPDIKYTTGENQMCIARYTLAVDRRFKREGEPDADFISCISFGKVAEFAEKYYSKATKICIEGRIQTGSYTNKDGNKVYTTDVVVESQEFAESKANSQNNAGGGNATQQSAAPSNNNVPTTSDGFLDIAEEVDDIDLPFM